MPETYGSERGITVAPSPREVLVGQERFQLKEYSIGEAPEGGVISPGNMETGSVEEIETLYGSDPARINNSLRGSSIVPYSFLLRENGKDFGNYTTPGGQDEFRDSDLLLTRDSFSPPEWAKELWDFAQAKKRKTFQTDNTVACLRALSIKDGKPVFTMGAGKYSESFYSNGMEGVQIGITDEERQLLQQKLTSSEMNELESRSALLEGTYGAGRTIRDVIASRYGHVPEFGDHIYNNNVGVAGMVLTGNNEFVFVKRGANVSVNKGISSTASGAAEFNEALLSQYGLAHFLGNEMARETTAELGPRAGALIVGSMKEKMRLELGVDEGDYDLVPVGFIRELTRGGKPECMFLIRYHGATDDLVKSIAQNPNMEKKEIDGLVLSMTREETARLLETKGATSFIHHQAVANLMLCNEYLRTASNV